MRTNFQLTILNTILNILTILKHFREFFISLQFALNTQILKLTIYLKITPLGIALEMILKVEVIIGVKIKRRSRKISLKVIFIVLVVITILLSI